VNSFKTRAELYENILALPAAIGFRYYANAMERMNFPGALLNSFLVTILSLFFIVVFTSMCAWMLGGQTTG
jgi:raffinose/stachyose/melibiose transport system permease protein